jgi:ABC-type nitrate/sulfonate/bicarbonate transport system substrate-binding protein
MSTAFDSRRRSLLALGAACAAGCAWPALGADAPAGGKALKVGLLRNPVAGLIAIADEKGWFREAGLQYSPVLFAGAGGPKVIQAMGGGSVDLGTVSATAALLALASGAVPLQIVSIATDPVPAFVVLSAPEIRTVADLKGKRVSTSAGTGLQYFLARALGKFGMSLRDVEFVNLPVGDAHAAFLAGRVDAVVPSLNGRFYIRSLRKDTRELFTADMFAAPPGQAVKFEDYDVFVAPRSVVASHRDALRALLAAYHGRAVPYLHDRATHDAAIAEITRYVNVEQKSPIDATAMRQQLEASRFFDVAAARAIMAGPDLRAGLEDQLRFLAESKALAGTVRVDDVIARGLLD